MAEKGTLGIKVVADLSDVKKGIGSLAREPFSLKLDDKNFTQPLGRITGKLGEFDKSLEASNARVIAFGASAGAIYAVERALKATVSAAVNVEKQLSDINVILNASQRNLARFGDELFKIAGNTGQSFKVVANAATELARQGLSVEETLRRTSDALVLTRLSGLDAVSSVESLTAAINSFNKVALSSTEIVNKLANVDAAFAVSSSDLAEALRRVGSTAADAGVSFDQLVAAVTSAQQTTARGGSVIGNSFKTIFTRLQRPAVLKQLEQLGIQTRTLGDEARPVIGVLSDLAKVYDRLGSAQRSQISELIGGVFQINIVKAALSDLGKQYSIYDRALQTSANSTNEAIRRNEELNKTLSALINKTFANLERVGSRVGEGAFGPAIKTVLGAVNSALDNADADKGAKEFGGRVAEGIFKGLGDFLSGPGLVIGGALLIKLFGRLSTTLADAFKTIAQNNKQTQLRIKLEEQAFAWLSKNPDLLARIATGTMSISDAQKSVLGSIQSSTQALNVQYNAVQKVVQAIIAGGKVSLSTGLGASRVGEGSLKAGGGLVPTPQERASEKALAAAHGYSAGGIMADNIEGVGRVVYNSREKKVKFPGMSTEAIIPPKSSDAGKNYRKQFKKKHGFDPYSAAANMASGYVPNFALSFTRNKDMYNVQGTVGDVFGLYGANAGLQSPLYKDLRRAYADPASKGKRGRNRSLLEPDDLVRTKVKVAATGYTKSWRDHENTARMLAAADDPAGGKRGMVDTKSGITIPARFYPTDLGAGDLDGTAIRSGDAKFYRGTYSSILRNPNNFYRSTIGKSLRAALLEKRVRSLKESSPRPQDIDKINLGTFGLVVHPDTQLPASMDLKKKKKGGTFKVTEGITQSQMVAGGHIPNFARYVFDKDAYVQKYADKGLLQSRLDETGAKNLADLFDYDVMQAGKKGRLTLINAPAGAGKTSLAVGKTGKGQIAYDTSGFKTGDHAVVVRASQAISSGPKSIMNRSYAPFIDKFISLLPDSEAVRAGRESRNKSGKFMFGREGKQTSGATTDFNAAAAVLHSAVPFGKHKGLSRGTSGGWRMMSGSSFPAAHTVPVANTRGAFTPFTLGHQSVVDQMRSTGLPMMINVSGGVDREADIGWSKGRKRDLVKQTNPDAFVFSSKVPPETFTAPSDMTVKAGGKTFNIKKGDAINTAATGSKMFLGSDRAQQSRTGKSGLFDIVEVKRTGEDISATKVRKAIAAGDRAAYSSMLGGPTTKFVDENIGDIQAMQRMIGDRNAKKLSAINNRLAQLWGAIGVDFDPVTGVSPRTGKFPRLEAKLKKQFPTETAEIQKLKDRKKGLGTHKWTKRVFPHLAGGYVPNFASKTDAEILQLMTQRMFGPKPSISGFNNPRYMGILNRPGNENLLSRYNALKGESLERAGATQARADAITKEVVSGAKVNTMFLENIAQPTVNRRQPNIMRYGFDPAILPDVERTFNNSIDRRWEKLIKGVAFDSFSKIPHQQLSRMGGMKSLMSGLSTRGLTGSAATRIALGPIRGRVFEELLFAMSSRVDKSIPETGTEGLDMSNRRFNQKYKRLFTQGSAITGLGGQGMEIRSGGISNKKAMEKAGFAAGGALGEAINREVAAGVPRSAIRVGASPRLASGLNPAGLGVYNTIHEPGGLSQGINMHKASGLDPRMAGIPNFARASGPADVGGGVSGRTMAGMRELDRAASTGAEVLDDFLGEPQAESGFAKFQSKALQASFIFPMLSGQIQSFVGTTSKTGKVFEALSQSVGTAAAFIGVGGKFGLAAGAVVGGFTFLDKTLGVLSSNTEELAKKADEAKEEFTKMQNSITGYGDVLQKYQEALDRGDVETTSRLFKKLNESLSQVPAAYRASVAGAKNATDLQNKMAKAFEEQAKITNSTKFTSDLEALVTGERTGIANFIRREGIFGLGKGGELFDTSVFEEIPGAAKQFAEQLKGTLDFEKLADDFSEMNFEMGNTGEFLDTLRAAGASSEIIAGLGDLDSRDMTEFGLAVRMLTLNAKMAKEQQEAINKVMDDYSDKVKDSTNLIKHLEQAFKDFITQGERAAQTLSTQIEANNNLVELGRKLGREGALGDAQRALDTRRPFMSEEAIAVSESRINRRRLLDQRNARFADINIGGEAARRNAIIELRSGLLSSLATRAREQGGKKDPVTGQFLPSLDSDTQKRVANFLRQSGGMISGQTPIGVGSGTGLVSLLQGSGILDLGAKGTEADLAIQKANQDQLNELATLRTNQEHQIRQEEKNLQAQLEQIQIQKDIRGAGGLEGFASGQGLDQALDAFSTGVVGLLAGRRTGSLSIMGRGATLVESGIQQATGGPSGNIGLRNIAAAGRAENLRFGFGLMRGTLGNLGFGSQGLSNADANRMAANQADAFFKTGGPISPAGDAADRMVGEQIRLATEGNLSGLRREELLRQQLSQFSNFSALIASQDAARQGRENIVSKRSTEITQALEGVAAEFAEEINSMTQDMSDFKGALNGLEERMLVLFSPSSLPHNQASGYLPRKSEKRAVMASDQYSPAEKSRALPISKMVNGQMTTVNHLEAIKNNYGGTGQTAVLTPAMQRGGFANGFIPNFAVDSKLMGELIDGFDDQMRSYLSKEGLATTMRTKGMSKSEAMVHLQSRSSDLNKMMSEFLYKQNNFGEYMKRAGHHKPLHAQFGTSGRPLEKNKNAEFVDYYSKVTGKKPKSSHIRLFEHLERGMSSNPSAHAKALTNFILDNNLAATNQSFLGKDGNWAKKAEKPTRTAGKKKKGGEKLMDKAMESAKKAKVAKGAAKEIGEFEDIIKISKTQSDPSFKRSIISGMEQDRLNRQLGVDIPSANQDIKGSSTGGKPKRKFRIPFGNNFGQRLGEMLKPLVQVEMGPAEENFVEQSAKDTLRKAREKAFKEFLKDQDLRNLADPSGEFPSEPGKSSGSKRFEAGGTRGRFVHPTTPVTKTPSRIPDPFDAAKNLSSYGLEKGAKFLSLVGETVSLRESHRILNPNIVGGGAPSGFMPGDIAKGRVPSGGAAGHNVSPLGGKSSLQGGTGAGYRARIGPGKLAKFALKWLSGAGEVMLVHEAATSSGSYAEYLQDRYGITIGEKGGLTGRMFDVGPHTPEEENELFKKSLMMEDARQRHNYIDFVMGPTKNFNKVFPIDDKTIYKGNFPGDFDNSQQLRNKSDREFFKEYNKRLIRTRKAQDDLEASKNATFLERASGAVPAPYRSKYGATRDNNFLYAERNRKRYERIKWQLNNPGKVLPEDKVDPHLAHLRRQDAHKTEMTFLQIKLAETERQNSMLNKLISDHPEISSWKITPEEMKLTYRQLLNRFKQGKLSYQIKEAASNKTSEPVKSETSVPQETYLGGMDFDEFMAKEFPEHPADSAKQIREEGKTALIAKIGAEEYNKRFNEDGSLKPYVTAPVDHAKLKANQKQALKEAKERRRYGGLTKAQFRNLSPLQRRMRGLANGYIPNFAALTDLSQSSWMLGNGFNPYSRDFMMNTPGLRGLLNPGQSFGRVFAGGLIPSISASQTRERMQSGRNDVYTRYVDTPKYSGYATFNGTERGMEEAIVRNHPNPKRAGATPNFASGTMGRESLQALEILSNKLTVISDILAAQGQNGGQGQANGSVQMAMSPLNVNVNHSGRLTAEVEQIQSQISSAINEAMKQIAPALWRTIKGPATS